MERFNQGQTGLSGRVKLSDSDRELTLPNYIVRYQPHFAIDDDNSPDNLKNKQDGELSSSQFRSRNHSHIDVCLIGYRHCQASCQEGRAHRSSKRGPLPPPLG